MRACIHCLTLWRLTCSRLLHTRVPQSDHKAPNKANIWSSKSEPINVGAEYWNIETEYWNMEIEHPNIRMIEPNRCMNVSNLLSNSVLKRPDADRWTLIYLPSPPCTLHTSHTTNTALFIYFPVTTHRVPLLVINNKTALFVWSFRWWPTSGRPKPVPVLCINSRSHILIKYSIFWIRIHLMCLLTQ